MNQGINYDVLAVMGLARDTGLFVSLCTIQQPSGNFGPSGAPDNLWVDFLVDAPGQAMPLNAEERKALGEQTSVGMIHFLFDRLRTGIETRFRAVVDGVAYDILGVDQDSQAQMTTLTLRTATI